MFLKQRKVALCCITAFFLLLSASMPVFAEEKVQTTTLSDSTVVAKNKFLGKPLIIPAALMTYATIEVMRPPEKRLLDYRIKQQMTDRQLKRVHIDDYLQYASAASVYLLDLFGVKAKHNFKDRTLMLGMSAIFAAMSVNAMKYTIKENRPDQSARNSFPSGHTTVAFMSAEFLWQEYKDVSIWYGIAGYSVATATGVLRMYNNKHWFSDVVFGAGLGMLCTKASYWIYPLLQEKCANRRKNKKEQLAFYPYYNGIESGVYLSITL